MYWVGRSLCEIHTKQLNALCGQDVEIFSVKSGYKLSNH